MAHFVLWPTFICIGILVMPYKKVSLKQMQISMAKITLHVGSLIRVFVCYWSSCSKLTMSLVNDSLKFTLSDTQNMLKFFAEKM